MSDLNQVYLLGRLTKSAELTTLSTGTPLVHIALAVNRSVKDNTGNWNQQTNFFDCEYFGEYAAKSITELTKGREVLIEGELRQNRWEKDGKFYSQIKIYAQKVRALRRPGEGKNAINANASNNPQDFQANANNPQNIQANANNPEPDYPPDWNNIPS